MRKSLLVALVAFTLGASLLAAEAPGASSQLSGTWAIVGMYQFESDSPVEKTDATSSFFTLSVDGSGVLSGPAYGNKGVAFTWTADLESGTFTMDTGDWYIEGYFVLKGNTLILAAGYPEANCYIYVLEKAPKK